jgi:hypothetical protein
MVYLPRELNQCCSHAAAGDRCVGVLCVEMQVAWLNNPEKDKDYAHLPSDTTHILNMYPGRLNPMAANLFYMTVIGDPLKPESVNMAKIMATVKTRWVQSCWQAPVVLFGCAIAVEDLHINQRTLMLTAACSAGQDLA